MKGHLTNEEIYITMGKDLEITTMVLIPIDVTSRIVDENLIMSNWGYPIIVLGTKQVSLKNRKFASTIFCINYFELTILLYSI